MKTFFAFLPFEIKAALLALMVAGIVLGATFGVSRVMERYVISHTPPPRSSTAPNAALADQGHHLFLMNCVHCHAADATGDEGPDLHGVKKSDERIRAIIRNGIKGEMPKFGQKFKDEDVQALVAFIRSLK